MKKAVIVLVLLKFWNNTVWLKINQKLEGYDAVARWNGFVCKTYTAYKPC